MKQFLREELNSLQANLVESIDNEKNYYLTGISMQANIRNGNNRIYPLAELSREVSRIQESLKAGNFVIGELQHPDSLMINLQNASHAITEIKMDGDNAISKMKLLDTPAGNIARAILEGGVRLGVSSRGAGNVGNDGTVSDFQLVTIDIVHQPSAPNAYPNFVREAQEHTKIVSLAEAVVHDKAAQKYLAAEMKKFIKSILN
ncbi:MAG: hypothetical protein QXN55_01235 [Candidatus Nitrosotenuis sp.]